MSSNEEARGLLPSRRIDIFTIHKKIYEEGNGGIHHQKKRKEGAKTLKPAEQGVKQQHMHHLFRHSTEIATPRATKRHEKTLRELTTEILKKATEGDMWRSPNKLHRARMILVHQRSLAAFKLGKRRIDTKEAKRRSTISTAIGANRARPRGQIKG
jgi:hypothetical protein